MGARLTCVTAAANRLQFFTLNDPCGLAIMELWSVAPRVALSMSSGHTLSGGNGRDDGSAPSFRIGVIPAAGAAGPCRTNHRKLTRVAMIAVRRVNAARVHGADKRLVAGFAQSPS